MKRENPLIKNPLVSIIVITYNSSRYVLETLESIRDQSYSNLELIISDDSSTDDTVEVCERWLKKNQFRFVRTRIIKAKNNQGIPANCNQGIRESQGDWIRIIAGDDALVPNSIQTYVDYLNEKSDPSVQVLHSNVDWYEGSFTLKNKLPFQPLAHYKLNKPSATSADQFQCLLRVNTVEAGTIFINKKVFHHVGLYDEEPKLWEDRPMLLKITKGGIKLHYLDFCSLKYRKHTSSIQTRRKSNKYLSDYIIIKSSYFYNNYLHYLPFFERVVKTILLKRILYWDKFNLNKNNPLLVLLFKMLGFPWTSLNNRYKKKFL